MLKYLFGFILLLHALIHFRGFAKAYNFADIPQLTKFISKPIGLIWLLAALLFVAGAVLFFLKKESWTYVILIAVVISQILIITDWKDAKFGTVLNLMILFATIVSYATFHFEMRFKADVQKHISETDFSHTDLLTEADIALLPAPVQK